jgi:hypothetical protein
LEPELAHPLWNALKRSLKVRLPSGSDLSTSVLKLSIIANYSHGAFKSGDKFTKMKESFHVFMAEILIPLFFKHFRSWIFCK